MHGELPGGIEADAAPATVAWPRTSRLRFAALAWYVVGRAVYRGLSRPLRRALHGGERQPVRRMVESREVVW